jgi:hypothetical protein
VIRDLLSEFSSSNSYRHSVTWGAHSLFLGFNEASVRFLLG